MWFIFLFNAAVIFSHTWNITLPLGCSDMYTYNPKRWTAVYIILHNHASIVVTLGINTSTWIVESNEFTRESGLKQKIRSILLMATKQT